MKELKWSEPSKASPGRSHYDHVYLDTPIGVAMIEWKSWKERPAYDVEIAGEWVGAEWSLEDAKKLARQHLEDKHNQLKNLLGL